MRILVTGGSGLVGRCLRDVLPNATYLSSSDLDLSDRDAVRSVLREGWDRVIHLAARVGGIVDNTSDQVGYLEENLIMSTSFVRECRAANVPRLTAVLSSCIYPENNGGLPLREQDMFKGEPPESNYGYAMAKRVLAKQVEMSRSPLRAWNCIIPCNLYGPGDKTDPRKSHFVTALLRKIREASAEPGTKEIRLLGDGTPVRQFMDARDLAAVILEMVRRDVTETFNVAPGLGISVREIAERVTSAILGDSDFRISFDGNLRLSGQAYKDINTGRFDRLFPGFSFTSLEDGATNAYQWLEL